MHHLIFYGSYLAFPALAAAIYVLIKKPSKAKILALLVILLFIYSRFIETQIITIKTTEIDLPNIDHQVQVAIISDPQVGVYRTAHYLDRIVSKTNQLNPDLVLIPGDITYHASLNKIPKLLQPLQNLQANTLAVLGNHDYATPGTASDVISQAITAQLPIIDNTISETDDFTIAAYGSIFANNFDVNVANELQTDNPTIALMHNPDGTHYLDQQFDLAIAGHTHCGQIKIPILYKPFVPTKFSFEAGLQESPVGPLYISCGLGESLLPMRFFNPPTIDLLVLK